MDFAQNSKNKILKMMFLEKLSKVKSFLKITIIFGLTGAIFSACQFFAFEPEDSVENTAISKALIIPHHLIVDKDINRMFEEHQDPMVDTVILMSVNHFNDGFGKIQTADSFEESDVLIDQPLQDFLISQSGVLLDNKTFVREHGIFVHLDNVEKSFKNAGILPLIFKEDTSLKSLDELIENLGKYMKENPANYVVILSMDFNHYQKESVAYESDMEVVEFLENLGSGEKYSDFSFDRLKDWARISDTEINFDSPEGLYVLLSLLESYGSLDFNFVKRTSSASLTGISDPEMNTSHVFGWF